MWVVDARVCARACMCVRACVCVCARAFIPGAVAKELAVIAMSVVVNHDHLTTQVCGTKRTDCFVSARIEHSALCVIYI